MLKTLESKEPYQTTHVHLDKNNREIYYSISNTLCLKAET